MGMVGWVVGRKRGERALRCVEKGTVGVVEVSEGLGGRREAGRGGGGVMRAMRWLMRWLLMALVRLLWVLAILREKAAFVWVRSMVLSW